MSLEVELLEKAKNIARLTPCEECGNIPNQINNDEVLVLEDDTLFVMTMTCTSCDTQWVREIHRASPES